MNAIPVVIIFGLGAIACTAWAWHRRALPFAGAVTAFVLGPAWGAFLYSAAFCTDGSGEKMLLAGYSLGIGGLFIGLPLGLVLMFVQIVCRAASR